MSGDWVRVGRESDFPEGRGRAVELGGTRVALFRQGGRLFALQDACPHMGTSLAEGTLEPGAIRCHQHGWRFDLASGESDRRSGACAHVYEVRVEAGEVFIRRPAPPPLEPGTDERDGWIPFDPERHLKR